LLPKRTIPGLWEIFVCIIALATWLPASAQQDEPKAGQDSPTTFQANVNVVNLYFNVKDKHGLLIPHLTKDDFTVAEDGKPQTIKFFSADTSQPLTLGILIDSSASQTRVLDMEKVAGAEFLHTVMREKDLGFVISFDIDCDLLQDFTSSVKDLKAALNRARINSTVGGPPGLGGGPVPTAQNPKGTLLYDAVWLGAKEKLATEVGRKAMIILTDGEDQGSRETIKTAIEAAQKADAMIYVILIADRGFYMSQGASYGGEGAMKNLSRDTGGRVIDVGNNEKKLREAFDQISAELRSQYSVGYTSTNSALDGTFRKVEIKTNNKDYKVQARSGYYALKSRE
jgi:VWFA-related protein